MQIESSSMVIADGFHHSSTRGESHIPSLHFINVCPSLSDHVSRVAFSLLKYFEADSGESKMKVNFVLHHFFRLAEGSID